MSTDPTADGDTERESGSGSVSEVGPESVRDGRTPRWVGRYLRAHALHVAVVVLFALYPFVYDALVTRVGSGLIVQALLPAPRTMITVLILGLFAMSFDFISGYTGYLSFGHAAFFGLGAYFVVLGYNGQLPRVPGELPFMLLLVGGGVSAVLTALAVGAVAFRLSGVYFAMITLGVSEILFVAASNFDVLTPGAADPSDGIAAGSPPEIATFDPILGLPGVDPVAVELGAFGDQAVLGIDLAPLLSVTNPAVVVSYLAIGAVVLLSYLMMQRVIHSPFGRAMIAIRENEERARAIGYNTFRYKIGAFAISAFFGAVAGGLLVGYSGSVDPQGGFFFLVTGFALVAAIIGGLGTLAGPLFGYLFLETVEEFLAREGNGGGLQALLEQLLPAGILEISVGGLTVNEALDAFMTGHGEFYAGIIFVLFVLFLPIGVLGTLRGALGERTVATALSRRLGRRDQSGATTTDGPDP